MIATKIIKENNLEPQLKNVKTNKTFLARFGAKSTSSSKANKPNDTQNEVIIKCLNESPKKTSIPTPIRQVPLNVDNEISVISNRSDLKIDEDNLSSSKSNIDLIRSSIENDKELNSIINIFANNNCHKNDTKEPYYQEVKSNNCQDDNEEEINITHYDSTEKSKVRSQFMQRFAKRQITPQVIPQNIELEQNNVNEEQANLEERLNLVMEQLDELKKEKLKSHTNDERRDLEERINNLIDVKLKYIEKLQENQFKLMSQLITNAVGPQQSKAQYDKYARSPSPNKSSPVKNKQRKKTRSRSKEQYTQARSLSPIKYEPSYGCLQCELNQVCKKHEQVKEKKSDFLKELLDLSSPVKNRNRSNETLNQSPQRQTSSVKLTSTINDNSNDLLFDKYLTQTQQLEDLIKAHKQKEDEINKLNLKEKSVLKQTLKSSPQKGLFSDFDEVLKEIENSKSMLENDINTLLHNRENNLFYHVVAENSITSQDEKENIRMRKLVDGYLDAISNEVKKEVLQEIIDQSKHVKLEAEKDEKSNGQIDRRSRTAVKNQTQPPNKPIVTQKPKAEVKTSEKYLKSIYGNELLEKIKKEKSKFDWSSKTKISSQTDLMLEEIHKSNDDIFDKIIAKPVQLPKLPTKTIDNKPNKFQQSKVIQKPIEQIKSEPLVKLKNPPAKVPIKAKSNIGIVTVPFKEPEKENKAKKLLIQNQPAINISPEVKISKENSKSEHKNVEKIDEIKSKYDASFESDDDNPFSNQEGAGLQLPGYHNAKQVEQKKIERHVPSAPKLQDKLNYQIQPSSDDLAEKLRAKDLLENRALDWIEQELIARFVSTLTRQHEKIEEISDPVESTIDESESEISISQNESVLINILGQPGFQVFVDNGQQIDPDLVQALTREVLEEQLNVLLSNPRQLIRQDEITQPSLTAPQPAKRSFERNSNENLFANINRVPTPEATPKEQSPESSPRTTRKRPKTPELSPNESVNQEIITEKPQIIQQNVPQVIEIDELDDTLTMSPSEEESEVVELVLDPKLIIQTRTPERTPRQSPSPPSTPVISIVEPEVPPPPTIPIVKVDKPKKVSISVQVETEQPVVRPTPPPQPRIIPPAPVKTKSPEESFTESTSYTSENESSTTIDETSSEISYLSEGAWAISKSEGQIINIPGQNVVINLSGESTSEGEYKPQKIQPRQQFHTQVSEGELRLPVDKSDGEVLSSSSLRAKPKKDKTVVSLRASKNDSKKNNILVQSLTTDGGNSRDSKEFDRKMFSSTPDSTAAFNIKKIELPNDILEYRISTGNSLDLETQNDNKKITINMPTSFDDFEDTFSNVSDM